MFRECINAPIDPIPVEYVAQINRLLSEPDYSLTCLGIALMKDRIEDYKGIAGTYSIFTNQQTCIDDLFVRETNNIECPIFCYYVFTSSDKDVKETLIENNYEIIEKIGAFLKDKAGVECLAVHHKEKNLAAVFINSRDIKYFHLLISFLSLFFPNVFKDKPLGEKDYNIIKSLAKNDKAAFVQKIQEAVAPYTMEFRRLMLGTLLKQMHERKIADAQNNVNEQRRYVDTMKSNYVDAIERLKELIVLYEGMKATELFDKPEEELIEYLSTNKALRNLTINGSKLAFTVATLLNNYNSDAWASFSKAGYIFDGKYNQPTLLDAFKDRKNREILLNNIFSESPEFAIKMCSNYTLDFSNCNVTSSRTYDYVAVDPIFKGYIPNPHFKNFSCFGGYGTKIIESLRNRKYIVAVEYCCASAGSVNLEETEQNFRPMLGWLLTSREKVLRRRDGVEMTPEEALIYLVDKEKVDETD